MRQARRVSPTYSTPHQLEIVRLATLLVGDRPTAEDVVQDVFTRLHAHWDRVVGRDVLPYARASVVNACRSVQRRRRIAHRFGGAREPAPPQSAESAVLVAEDRRQVLAALATLPPRRREVLVLRYCLGLSDRPLRPGGTWSPTSRPSPPTGPGTSRPSRELRAGPASTGCA